MQRYISSSKDRPEVSLDDVHHIKNVMRGRLGDAFEIVFEEKIYKMEITSLNPFSYKVIDIDSTNNELKEDITIFYVLSKGDKNDFVIQKATELGVKRIVLLTSSRSVIRMNQEDFLRKKVRYEKIIKEASEQSKRNVVPEIIGLYNINKIPSSLLASLNLVAYEKEANDTSKLYELLANHQGESISILIGSEGGLSEEEVDTLNKQGFINVSLGKRILRTETAAVYALSIIAFMLERK